jgi:hypothetical protein
MQANIDIPIVSSIFRSTKSLYRHGRPLHHLSSARSRKYDHEASIFFVTTAAEFTQFSAREVQEIFRHRHIVVTGPAPRDFQFDRAGLSMLGCLTTPRDIQGMFHDLCSIDL